MIRILKLRDAIYENFEEKTLMPVAFDEERNPTEFQEVWTIPTDIEELKRIAIDTVKWQAGIELRKTDWVVVKCTELGLKPEEKYPEIIQKRQAIRDWSNQKEAEIQKAKIFEKLLEIVRDLRIPEELRF